MNKTQLFYYALKEIGLTQLADYAIYQIQKKSGSLARKTPFLGVPLDFEPGVIDELLPRTIRLDELKGLLDKNRKQVLQNADALLAGQYHPFGGSSQPLSFTEPPHPARHWLEAGDQVQGVDIKWLWEPARFTWAYELAHAWLLTRDERYADFFWQKFREFNEHNPVNSAPNFTSAQEVGIRLLNWLMVYQVLRDATASGADEKRLLAKAVWQHAARIPATLGYARSQNNNHLLSESLALMAAGMVFAQQSHQARKWLELGNQTFQRGILRQVEADGTYAQHSANYQRMMLQLSSLYFSYTQSLNLKIPQDVMSRLASATRWLNAQLDPYSGRLPNLGHNDGSLMLPMGSAEFRDHRPAAQAASLAFLERSCLPAGDWDLLSAWLGLDTHQKPIENSTSQAIKQLQKGDTRVLMRGVRFHGRPAHADQLHVEIWWQGVNIAQDAGTYCYNCDPPWQNSLASTLVHNTVCVDDEEQMVRAGKFLWLRQAQAKWIQVESNRLCASHDGYRRKRICHQRTVLLENETLPQVIDLLDFDNRKVPHQVRVHWLLPDWEWVLEGQRLRLIHQDYSVVVYVKAESTAPEAASEVSEVSLIRAGKSLAGTHDFPTLGWASDTYGEKHAALSFSVRFAARGGLKIISEFSLQKATAGR